MSLPGRVFIDTNIPLYASGPSFPLRKPCVQIMNAIGRGRLLAIIDVEVLQELMHFAYRRRQLDRGLMMSAGCSLSWTQCIPTSRPMRWQ